MLVFFLIFCKIFLILKDQNRLIDYFIMQNQQTLQTIMRTRKYKKNRQNELH